MFRLWSILVVFVVLGLDQLTKAWIRSHLAPGQSLFSIGIFRIDYVHNTGAAFGLFPGHSALLTGVSIIGAAAFCIFIICAPRYPILRRRLSLFAMSLLLAGTLGNLIDRLFIGFVTDFIDFTYWPAFNLADSGITVGVVLFAVVFLTQPKTAE